MITWKKQAKIPIIANSLIEENSLIIGSNLLVWEKVM